MISIFIAKIPQTFDAQRSAECFKKAFCGDENLSYLQNILSRKSTASVSQSLCALTTLAEGLNALKISTTNLTLKKSQSGKPYFEGADNLFFSISHDADTVCVAISDSEVGVDIESNRHISSQNKISARYFTKQEQTDIAEKRLDFLTVWTKREAYAKLLGTSLASTLAAELPQDVIFYTSHNENYTFSVASHTKNDIEIHYFS